MTQYLLLLCLLFHLSYSYLTFDVYRLVQYDKVTEQFGSRRTSVNLLATTLNAVESNATLSRHIIVVDCQRVSVDLLEMYARDVTPAGLLILLPETAGDGQWEEMEGKFLDVKFEAPVYFARMTEDIKEMYNALVQQDAGEDSGFFGTDSWRLVVSSLEAKPISTFPVKNYQGWLVGKGNEESSTIAIVANYDTFGISPGLSTGVDMNGSGVIAILELARYFSKLYSDVRSKSDYNILFILTSSGRLNYEATGQWIDKADDDLLDSVEVVLCLNALLSEDLFLHVSRSEKNPAVKRVYDTFRAMANTYDIPFEIARRPIDLSKKEIPFQHEQFARKKMFSLTLSGHNYSTSQMNASNLYDIQNENTMTLFNKNMRFLIDVVSHLIYDIEDDVSVLTDTYNTSEIYTNTWLEKMGHFPRMVPYFLVEKENELLDGIERELRLHLSELDVLESTIQMDITFYDKTVLEMSAYRAKPLTFDILISLAVLTYCLGLFTVLTGFQETVTTFKRLIQRRKK